MMKKETKIWLSIGSVILVAILGSVFVNLGMEWFDGLIKPTEWVPNILIPIVWTVIYLVAIAYLWLALNRNGINKELAILLGVNGLLNVVWCLTFFTLNSLLGGLVFILLNLIAGTVLLIELSKDNKLYSYMLMIYPLWLSLATCLNLACWILN